MSGSDRSFWRNAGLIGAAHVAVLIGVIRWSAAPPPQLKANVLWMDGGAVTQVASVASAPQPTLPPMPAPAESEEHQEEDDADEPSASSAQVPSEIALPSATPRPSATIAPTTAPKRAIKVTTKVTPKRSPKSKKTLLAKASTTPRPKRSATPKPEEESTPPVKSESSPAPTAPPDVLNAIAAAARNAAPPTAGISGPGSGGRGLGAGGASQFGWYAHMLHDRFFSQWAQPTSVVRSGVKMSTLVKLRIEKDGRVSRFTILRPSGNVVVDESVAAVAKRVTQVDPLPTGLSGGAGFYEVNINFELNSDL